MSATNTRTVLCLAAAVFALSTAAASAQTVQLLCTFPNIPVTGTFTELVTVDYSARTLGVDFVDPAGNVTIMAQHRNPATITDETVSAEWRNGPEFFRYTLNRYSGVLLQGANLGGGYRQFYSSPCAPYQRGPKKY